MTDTYISFEDIRSLKQSFKERIGLPDECTSALGYIIVGFSWLEASLDRQIHALAGLGAPIGHLITTEMSYKAKVSLLSCLVINRPALRQFNVGKDNVDDVWRDLSKMLAQCEELRNRIAHSRWHPSNTGTIQRTKMTAKGVRGLRVTSEELDSAYLLDVYDYFLNVDYVINEFFM